MELAPALHRGLQRHRMHCHYQYSLVNSVHLLHPERGVDCD